MSESVSGGTHRGPRGSKFRRMNSGGKEMKSERNRQYIQWKWIVGSRSFMSRELKDLRQQKKYEGRKNK